MRWNFCCLLTTRNPFSSFFRKYYLRLNARSGRGCLNCCTDQAERVQTCFDCCEKLCALKGDLCGCRSLLEFCCLTVSAKKVKEAMLWGERGCHDGHPEYQKTRHRPAIQNCPDYGPRVYRCLRTCLLSKLVSVLPLQFWSLKLFTKKVLGKHNFLVVACFWWRVRLSSHTRVVLQSESVSITNSSRNEGARLALPPCFGKRAAKGLVVSLSSRLLSTFSKWCA